MTRGMLASVLASTMLGALYFIVTLMKPLTAQDIFAARMLLSSPMVAVVITLLGEWPLVRAAVVEILRRPGLVLVYLVNAANASAQLLAVHVGINARDGGGGEPWLVPDTADDGIHLPVDLPRANDHLADCHNQRYLDAVLLHCQSAVAV